MWKKLLVLMCVALLLQGCFGGKRSRRYQPKQEPVKQTIPEPAAPKGYFSDKPVVMFILDTSGSMNGADEGTQTKISKAKSSITDTINQLDRQRFNCGLVVFDGMCGAKLAVPPDNNDPEEIIRAVQAITPSGSTPLSKAIELSGEALKNIDKKMIILLSDGHETCGKSPVQEARKLYNQYGIKINFQVIGYAVNNITRSELEQIGQIDQSWQYHDAKKPGSLAKVIDTIVTEHKLRDDTWKSGDFFTFEFSSGSADLSEAYLAEIEKIYRYLKYNSKKIEIVGHTDSVGSAALNQKLSVQRASMVRDKLLEWGIGSERMSVRGAGEEQPVATNDTAEGRRQNRRVEITIVD